MVALRAMLLLTVVSLGLHTPNIALADPPLTHALIHIENKSSAPATLYYKWGNGAWKKTIVEKETKHYFNYPYDGTSQKSPDFHVILDVDTDKGTKFVEHVLSRGASPDDNSPKYGHHYVIKQLAGTDTRFLEAVTNKATVKVTDKNAKAPTVPKAKGKVSFD